MIRDLLAGARDASPLEVSGLGAGQLAPGAPLKRRLTSSLLQGCFC